MNSSKPAFSQKKLCTGQPIWIVDKNGNINRKKRCTGCRNRNKIVYCIGYVVLKTGTRNDSQQDEYMYGISLCYHLKHTKYYSIESNMHRIGQDSPSNMHNIDQDSPLIGRHLY